MIPTSWLARWSRRSGRGSRSTPEPEADARAHPAARLHAALQRVSEHQLVPQGQHLVVLIDGLDEYDPPADTRVRGPGRDPLAAFLPSTLPRGVSLLCASRPRHPHVDLLAARGAQQSISTVPHAPMTTRRPCVRSGRPQRQSWAWTRRSLPRRWSAPAATPSTPRCCASTWPACRPNSAGSRPSARPRGVDGELVGTDRNRCGGGGWMGSASSAPRSDAREPGTSS